jgi:hypothetical protein
MKAKKFIVEIICLVLIVNFFYEGLYKLIHIDNYGFWVTHTPFLKSMGKPLTYVIPVGEIVLSLLFLVPSCRIFALYSTLAGLILFVLWIMGMCLFTHFLFWPYHALWAKPNWVQKMLISIGLCWLSFTAIILSTARFLIKEHFSNSLRNTPANVSR